ncbi:MAG: hypothetical protein AAFW87_06930 [Pseudomonadota bacterium]
MTLIEFTQTDIDLACRAIGLIGFSLYVIGFLLLSTGKIESSKIAYFLLTLTAALCVMISLTVDFNLSSALIQLFYVLFSLCAIALRLRKSDVENAT